MSRLYEFMKMSTGDDSIAKFRSVSFRLVKENTEHSILLDSIDTDSAKRILEMNKALNAELRKWYKGQFKFDLCIDEGVGVDALKLKKKQAKTLSLICHETNDKLSKIKKNIEINLTSEKDK
jgi:hypothetical protein